MTTDAKTVTYYDEYFGDAVYRFNLIPGNWDLLIELERKIEKGLFVLFRELTIGNAKVMEAREVIRLGLIGGGKAPKDAETLVRTYFDLSPLSEGVSLAVSVLGSAIYGRHPDGTIVAEEVADGEA